MKTLKQNKNKLKKEKELLIEKFIDKLSKLDGSKWEWDLMSCYDINNNYRGYYSFITTWKNYKIELEMGKLSAKAFEPTFHSNRDRDLKLDAFNIAKKAEYTLTVENADEDTIVESSGFKIRNLCDIVNKKVHKSLLEEAKKNKISREYNEKLKKIDLEVNKLDSEVNILKKITK